MTAQALEFGRPIEGSSRRIPAEEWEALGLDFSISPQALAEIEKIDANARHAIMNCRFIILD